MARLPFRIRDLLGGFQEVRRSREKGIRILIAGPPGESKEWLRNRLIGGAQPQATVGLYDLTGEEPAAKVAHRLSAQLVILLFDGGHPIPAWATSLIRTLSLARKPVVVAVWEEREGAGGRTAEHLAALSERTPDRVALVSSLDQELDQLHRLCAEAAGDHAIALAANFPVFRRTVARQAIERAARRNGLVGVAAFIPGSDMPLITATQIKLILELAAIHGEELGAERAKELLAVIGSGYVLRAAARQAAGIIPLAGWAVKGAVAYGGTVALGRLALEYFERQHKEGAPGG